jgi:hypothetical protein
MSTQQVGPSPALTAQLRDPAYSAYLALRTVFTVAPRFGAWVVAVWLAGIIIDLVTVPGFYDIALRDFGLLVGAVALARLAQGVHNGSISVGPR